VRRVYLDYSATTPVHPEAAEAAWPFLNCRFANPSSDSAMGRDVRNAVEDARKSLARFIGADPGETLFTSGGTESNNLAVLGTALRFLSRGGRVITSPIEHAAVLGPVQFLENLGFQTTYLPVDGVGRVNPSDLERALGPDAILVSIMLANNETGVVQDIPALAAIARRAGVLFHTDAVQGLGKMPVDVRTLGVDLLSLSGHKVYAPKGVGALWVRRGVELAPVLRGGGQERGLRPGTENVPGIVALGRVSEILSRDLETEMARLQGLRALLRNRIVKENNGIFINSDCESCLCNTLSLCISGAKSAEMVSALDRQGVTVSGGSACQAGCPGPSHVLVAMGVPKGTAECALRITLGRETTDADIHIAADAIRAQIQSLR
jgi:cysteine desulfurase